MSFDASTAQTFTDLINRLGYSASITRAGTKIWSGKAVNGKKQTTWGNTDAESSVSGVIDYSATAFIPATAKQPLPGDLFVTKTNTYMVNEVEVYQPADVVLAYKLSLT